MSDRRRDRELESAYFMLVGYAAILSVAGYSQGRVVAPTLNLIFVGYWIYKWIQVLRRPTTPPKGVVDA